MHDGQLLSTASSKCQNAASWLQWLAVQLSTEPLQLPCFNTCF